MTAPTMVAAMRHAADHEPHRERVARDGEDCDICARPATVVYVDTGIRWCGMPHEELPRAGR
ncbi:MAG: hypothetical protein ACRD0V_07230 [Acidimicrobiales bacterium]